MPYKIKDFGAQKNQILNFYRPFSSEDMKLVRISCGAIVGFSNHHNQSSIASLRVARVSSPPHTSQNPPWVMKGYFLLLRFQFVG